MKRTLPILVILFFQFLLIGFSLINIFEGNIAFGLFVLNLFLFAILIFEPYWKIGGWFLFLVFSINLIFILNKVIINFFVILSEVVALGFLSMGLLVTFIAHKMKLDEFEENLEEFAEEPKVADAAQLPKNDQTSEVKPENPKYIATLIDNKVHLQDCDAALGVSEENKVIVGSKRFAQSKYISCEKCSPFN